MHVCQCLRQVRASACDTTAAGGIIGVPDIRFERQADGMSGGPVFYLLSSGAVQIIGSVSAYYHANRSTLPGLLVAQGLSHFHEVAGHLRSMDEAHAAKREF